MRSHIFIYALFLLILTSCQQEMTYGEKTGFLQFSIEKNTSTILVPTRTSQQPIALQVIDKTGAVVKETDDWNNWRFEPLELPLGTYTIKAFSKGVVGTAARFDEPYYAGKTEVTVVPKVNQNVNIECKLANVKVSVYYSADVKKYFTKLDCKVSNASGRLVFDKEETRSGYFVAENLNVALELTNTDNKSFTLESPVIANVLPQQHYRINYGMKTSGSVGDISITLDPTTKEYVVNISISKEANPMVNAWTHFVEVSVGTSVDVVTKACKYRVSGTEEWSAVPDEQVLLVDKILSARVTGLTPGTSYDFCFTTNGVDGKITTATTEVQTLLQNGSFDDWAQKGEPWFPGTAAEASSKNSFWDSGNVGSTTSIMNANPTSPESGDVHTAGGKAARLASQYVGIGGMGKFAAGNIYIGRYMATYSSKPLGARIRFGREFAARPTQLKGWYKYTRGTNIDYDGGFDKKTELESSGGDKCAIYIALTDNEGLNDNGVKTAYEIDNRNANSPTQYTIDLSENNKDVIAYGSITDEQSKGAANWTEFTIDLKYRSLTRKPKYIIVVASASKYGDFFTGSSQSVMLLDDFELVYGTPITAN